MSSKEKPHRNKTSSSSTLNEVDENRIQNAGTEAAGGVGGIGTGSSGARGGGGISDDETVHRVDKKIIETARDRVLNPPD